MTRPRIAPILATVLGLAAGCGPPSSNRSPTPDQAPDRFARAVREADDARRANQEAEASFYRRLGRPPAELPEDDSPALDPTSQVPELAHSQSGAGDS